MVMLYAFNKCALFITKNYSSHMYIPKGTSAYRFQECKVFNCRQLKQKSTKKNQYNLNMYYTSITFTKTI